MRRTLTSATVLLVMVGTVSSGASARSESAKPLVFTDQVEHPSALVPAGSRQDTIWFGGIDSTGIAVEGGTWDFSDGSFQGWTSVDEWENLDVYFGHVTAGDFTAHGDPCVPMFSGTTGQIWCGIHEDEADSLDFATGMGYGDHWCQSAFSPEFSIDASADSIDISFTYFNHTEFDFDSTHVFIKCFDGSMQWLEDYRVTSFNDSIGAYNDPQIYDEGVEILPNTLHPSTAVVKLEFRFTSDGSWSDVDGEWDCPCGPFAADDVYITVGADSSLYDFEDGPQGWTFDKCGGIGTFMGIVADSTYQSWLDDAGITSCTLSGYALEFVDEEGSSYSPPGHPVFQKETASSAPVSRAGYDSTSWPTTVVRYDAFIDLPLAAGTLYRLGYKYYPFTSPSNPTPRWSPRRGQDPWHYVDPPTCETYVYNLSTLDGYGGDPIHTDWDSMKVVYQVSCSCEAFGIDPCIDEGDTRGSPIVDNFRVGLVPPLLQAACCDSTTGACSVITEEECSLQGGVWHEDWDSCDPNPCPQPEYVCCTADSCQIQTEPACTAGGGDWHYGIDSCEPNPCVANTFIVRADGSGDFPTIQSAINIVQNSSVIQLANGTFTGDGNRDIDFLNKAITVRSQSNNPDSCIIDCQASEVDPHRGFHFFRGEQSSSVLRGITIMNGYTDNGGAGIRCIGSQPAVSNCILLNNFAASEGAGMYIENTSYIYIEDCAFAYNATDHPSGTGGLDCRNTAATVVNCSFEGNSGAVGGAFSARDHESDVCRLEGCVLVDNSASHEGGAIYVKAGLLECVNCTLADNDAPTGGGVRLFDDCGATFQNSIIAFNENGEALSCDGTSSATLTCSDVYGNPGGDYVGCISGQGEQGNNLSEDPLFCRIEDPEEPYTLRSNSPCSPDSNPTCGLIGAKSVACGPGYACCIGSECRILGQDACLAAGGEWLEGIETCDPDPCVEYACCVDTACQIVRQDECDAAGGEWLEGIETCDPDPCVEYACCVGDSCQMLREDECASTGGDWLETVGSCDPNPCPQYACCVGDSCQVLREADCLTEGGEWQVGFDVCSPNPCVAAACCTGEECELLAWSDCVAAGGNWLGEFATCDPNPCEAHACCIGDSCNVLIETDCVASGGEWQIGIESCDPNPCLDRYACCVGDSCQILTEEECLSAAGEWLEGLWSCELDPCGVGGKNAGGAMIVHTNDDVSYTHLPQTDYCGEGYDDPGSCENAGTRTDRWDYALIWFLAAFDPTATPGVTALEFGTNHNLPDQYWFEDYSACGPGVVEDPDADWPHEGGNTLTFSSTVTDHLFPFYWFVIYCDSDLFFGTAANPSSGQAAFYDDSIPAEGDAVSHFGTVRWYADGSNDCPIPPLEGTCCYGDLECIVTTEVACHETEGWYLFWLEGPVCDPNPCPVPLEGACCYGYLECIVTTEVACHETEGWYIWLEYDVCEPNPCPLGGACCYGDMECIVTTEVTCHETEGWYIWLEYEVCDPNPCPVTLEGACCYGDMECIVTTEVACHETEGWYIWLEGVVCDPNPCPVPLEGACCVSDSCQIETPWDCEAASGVWYEGIDCDPNPCVAGTFVVRPDGTGDFPTIQRAIDVVQDSSVVELTDGVFTGNGNKNLDCLGKAITIRSQSGDPEACVLDCEGSGFGIWFISGEGPESILEGVTIRNGWDSNFGGIGCDRSSPTLTNLILTENGTTEAGGGLICVEASPTLTNVTISGNTALIGGGLFCIMDPSPTMIDCTISGNDVGGGYGGGISCYASSPTLTRCTISGSTAGQGGGIVCEASSSPVLIDCILSGNSADYGGGMSSITYSSPILRNCTISGNSASISGGGMYFSDWLDEPGGGTLENVTFYSNSSSDSEGGAICAESGARVDLQHTIISFSSQGIAIKSLSDSLTLTCCDIYGNVGGDWVGSIADQFGIDGNIAEDPLFCDAPNEIFTLHSGSPCAAENNPGCGQIGSLPMGCGPAPPSNLTAETQGVQSILLSWLDNSSDEDGFEMERKVGAEGTWAIADSVAANSTNWEDTDVTEAETYYYRLRAWNEYGYSDYSNQASAVCGVLPEPPSNLVATAVSAVGIDLTWVDNADNEVGFHLLRRDWPAGEWDFLTPNPGANEESLEDRGLVAETEYHYRVRAYNDIGASEWSDSTMATTEAEADSFNSEIVVHFGAEPIEGASVLVASGFGFEEKGTTGPDGRLLVTGLMIGDSIRTQVKMTDRVAEKGGHEAVGDLMWELWLDSDLIQADGSYQSHTIETEAAEYDVPLVHPVFKYNLVVSVQWDIPTDDPYWNALEAGFRSASTYLYNASDGQVMLGSVAVYDDAVKWNDADVRIWPSEYPNADVDGIFEATANDGCIDMGEVWQEALPDEPTYFRTLIHELGHYALGLYEEYLNGVGLEGWWATYRAEHPGECPVNYGLMDYQYTTTENSSANDYLAAYPDSLDPWVVTNQYYQREQSCWDWLTDRLESYYPGIAVTRPDFGWYPDNVTPDRLGPTDDVGLSGDWLAFDSGVGSFAAELLVTVGDWPAGGAIVYRIGEHGPVYLGTAGPDGMLRAVGLEEGDEIRVYHRDRHGVTKTVFRASMSDLVGGYAVLALPVPGWLAVGVPRGSDERSPGAAVDARPQGTVSSPSIAIDLWPDEPIGEDPDVVCLYGGTVESLDMTLAPEEDRYSGEILIDISDALFDGRGIFEITLSDTVGNASTCVAAFALGEATPGEPAQLRNGPADLHVPHEGGAQPQPTLATACNALPFMPPGFEATAVTDHFSMHVGGDDDYPLGAGLNVAYEDSALVGIDETSLDLFRWDEVGLTWTEVDSTVVQVFGNVSSAPVYQGGIFCVFAATLTTDVIAPSKVLDFGGVTAEGQGRVELEWSAPGDDDMVGTALEYQIAYSNTEITSQEWDALPKLSGLPAPQAAGTREHVTVTLPEENHLYHLALRARDEAGNISQISNQAITLSGVSDPNELPDPPTDFRAVDTPGDSGGVVSLGWERSYDDGGGSQSVVEYRIYRNEPPANAPILLDSVIAGTSTHADTAAVTGSVYTYWLSASDGLQEAFAVEDRAFSARNLDVPFGDFTSDARVAINDFNLLVDTYGIDSTSTAFDPLFDLEGNGDIHTGDFTIFEDHFGEGGIPDADPPGQNASTWVYLDIPQQGGPLWHLNITVGSATNLAGYSFKVTYPTGTLTFVGASPDSAGIVQNILNRDGGLTPLFLVSETTPGTVWIANAVKQPTTSSAPDGDGFLAHVIFSGSSGDLVEVTDILLMDHEKRLNYRAEPAAIEPDADDILYRPFLFQSYPNPFKEQTTIWFQLPARSDVALHLYDVKGRLVRTLVEGSEDAGRHTTLWDGRSNTGQRVPTGIYFYQLTTPDCVMSRKLVHCR